MAEPVLNAPRVMAGVSQGIAAGDKLDAFEAAQEADPRAGIDGRLKIGRHVTLRPLREHAHSLPDRQPRHRPT